MTYEETIQVCTPIQYCLFESHYSTLLPCHQILSHILGTQKARNVLFQPPLPKGYGQMTQSWPVGAETKSSREDSLGQNVFLDKEGRYARRAPPHLVFRPYHVRCDDGWRCCSHLIICMREKPRQSQRSCLCSNQNTRLATSGLLDIWETQISCYYNF